MKTLRALAAAFSYFSIFPTRRFDDVPDADAITLLPWVGFAIGAVAGAGAYGIWLLTHSNVATAIVAWILAIWLSGAIHVDGFLDCCDGLFAMVPSDKRLEIMRDPHHGTYAIVGMAMISAVWIWALAQITPAWLLLVLPCCGAAARIGAVAAAHTFPNIATSKPVRANGAVRALGIAIPTFIVWSICVLEAPRATIGLVATGVSGFLAYFLGWLMKRRLGGLNGDCYGAIVVVTEAVLLLAVPYLASLR